MRFNDRLIQYNFIIIKRNEIESFIALYKCYHTGTCTYLLQYNRNKGHNRERKATEC